MLFFCVFYTQLSLSVTWLKKNEKNSLQRRRRRRRKKWIEKILFLVTLCGSEHRHGLLPRKYTPALFFFFFFLCAAHLHYSTQQSQVEKVLRLSFLTTKNGPPFFFFSYCLPGKNYEYFFLNLLFFLLNFFFLDVWFWGKMLLFLISPIFLLLEIEAHTLMMCLLYNFLFFTAENCVVVFVVPTFFFFVRFFFFTTRSKRQTATIKKNEQHLFVVVVESNLLSPQQPEFVIFSARGNF